MPDSKDATTGDKRKPDEAAQSRPEKAQKVDHQEQATLDDTVTSDKKSEPGAASNIDKTEKQHDHSPAPEADLDSNDENTSQHGTAVEPHGREGAMPFNMLEKGIIYFFLRGRVGIQDPEKVSDIARTFILLRPIPTDAELGDSPIGDADNARLICIPQEKLPKTGQDRWIAFVEKTTASFDELKDDFYPANYYETMEASFSHSPPVVPVGKGVYALTTTESESHLAYVITLPYDLGGLQTTIGLKQKGSWILSTRNPQDPAPSNTGRPGGPQYSHEILGEFRSKRWMETVPKHLVLNAQLLLVGESSGIQKAIEPDEEDKDDEDTNEPIEEMEELEHEDVKCMRHLGKTDSDTIFLDLEAYAKKSPQLQTES